MFDLNDETKKVSSMFFQYRNSIDIFTEDKQDSKEFYSALIKKLLKGTDIELNDVTPIGCKDDVIKSCKNDTDSSRKKLFIVDGDTNIIDDSFENHDNLFVLKAYCIENFLIDEESVCNYIYLSCGTKSITYIQDKLNYDIWLGNFCKSLIELFLHFAISRNIGSRFTLFKADKFFTKGVFKEELVYEEIINIKTEILSKISEDEYNESLNNLKMRWNYNINSLLTIVSGKDYLIPVTLFKIVDFKANRIKPSLDEAKINLLSSCTLERLEDLKENILVRMSN